jgi:hypothetical protein
MRPSVPYSQAPENRRLQKLRRGAGQVIMQGFLKRHFPVWLRRAAWRTWPAPSATTPHRGTAKALT